MSTVELSKEIGLHPNTIRAMVGAGTIPGIKIGGNRGWQFDIEKVKRALSLKRGNSLEKSLTRKSAH